MIVIAAAVFSFLAAWSAARLIAKHGLRWGLADIPNERSSHASTVPKGGGFGIPLAAAITGVLFARSQLIVVGASTVVAASAFFNDRREFSAGIRLLLEAVGAALVVFPMIFLKTFPESILPAAVFLLISIAYIVAQANFFNFMDGINGIAAIEAIVSFTLLGVYARIRGAPGVAIMSVAVVAGALGFLPLNFPRAKVFMGDVGSVFIGFLFAALIIRSAGSVREFLVLALFQGVFSVDCALTIVRRACKGDNLFLAHKEHLYQRMVHLKGWSHVKTSLAFGAVQAAFGIAAIFLHSSPVSVILFLWLGLAVSALFCEFWCFRRGCQRGLHKIS